MSERAETGIINTSWDSLRIPKKYDKMDKKARQEFLTQGVSALVKNMEDLDLGSHVLGNVRLIDKLVVTPIDQKGSIPSNEFDEAGVGFEYVTDIFTWAYTAPLNGGSTSEKVTEAERTTVVVFLKRLNGYLNEKYNPKPDIKAKVKRLLKGN